MAKKSKKGKCFSLFLNGKLDYPLFIVTIVLVCVGLMILLSASGPTSISETGNSTKYLIRQGRVVIIGFFMMIALSKIDYKIYKKLTVLIYIVCIVFLVVVGLVGTEEKGGKRWINIAGLFSFQPSEFVKIGIAIIYAHLLTVLKESGKISKITWGFILPIVLFLPFVFAVYVLQNHLSATLIMAAIMCVEMFVAGVYLRYFVEAGFLAVGLGRTIFNEKNGFRGSQKWI